MELAQFAFDEHAVTVAGDIGLSPELAKRLVKEVYLAWVGSMNQATPTPTAQRLKADVKRIESGASGVQVLDISFLRRDDGEDSVVTTFVVRVYPTQVTLAAEPPELAYADALSRSGRDAICCRVLPGKFLDNRAVVYYHAGPEFRRLDEVLNGLVFSADESVYSLFLDVLGQFLQTATDVYDEFTRAPSEIPRSQYLAHITAELPPDLVLDLRSTDPTTSPGTISLLDSPGTRVREVSPEALIEFVTDPRQKPVAVRVRFAVSQVAQSRYMTLPMRILTGNASREVWLLAGTKLLADPVLTGPTVQVEMLLPCPQLRTAADLLGESGFSGSEGSRLACLRMLSESAPQEFRAVLRHRDLHSGNVLATQTQLKLIDLGDVNEDLVGVDTSRLEVSLVRKLIDRAGLTLADLHAVIGAVDEPLSNGLKPRLERIRRLLTIFRRARDYAREKHHIPESQIALSRLLQALYYQRYLLAETLGEGITRRDSFAAYVEWILHDFRHTVVSARTSPGEVAPIESPSPAAEMQFGALWMRALSSPEGLVQPDAEVVLKAIQRCVGRAWTSPLTDLQVALLSENADTADDPFQSTRHVLLYGPTSCGKTSAADTFLVRAALLNVERRLSLYIAPTRALAQEKYHELRAKLANTALADGLVLSTGENLEQDHRILSARFSIAIMVYEKANILFSRNRRALDRLGCVVVDEVHMIEDLERGPMLEMALTKIQDNRRRMERRGGQGNENLRIIAISTEGADPGSLAQFLSVTDPDTLTAVGPLVFKGHKRPIAVEHSLVLPGSGSKRFDSVHVATIARDSDRVLRSERLLEIARALQPIQANLLKDSHGPSKTDLQERLFSLLASRITRLRGKGYRAVVFVPSKTDLEAAAETYRLQRHATEDGLAPDTLERLKIAAKSAGQMDTGHRVVLAAAKGVFIHHSEVEPAARRIIEEILAGPLERGSTQVVFATETLSYGVNLAVTDVILVGVRFYTSGRRRVLSQVPVSVCAFHNMMGRAGRLGRGNDAEASAFVLLAQESSPFNEIVKIYYSDVPALQSVLLDREDKAVLLEEFERNELGLTGGASVGQAFSYPFVRSVLDALRHLSVIASPSRAVYAKVPLVDLQSFLFRTLYAEQRLKSAAASTDRERFLFTTAIDYTLRDLGKAPLNLVDRESREGLDFVSITNRGEAIIDTGTEITTLKPLLEIVRKLQLEWASAAGNSRFPTALYLLAVVSQNEAYRHIIRCAPEVSDADMLRLLTEDAAANRSRVLESMRTTLADMSVELPDSMPLTSLRDLLDAELTSARDSSFFGKYEGGLTDAVMRLFAALAAWSRGSARGDVRELILGSPGDAIRSNQLSGFGAFRDQASWKLVFLARILGSRDASAGMILDTRDERRLYSLALSVRIGCKLEACRLIFQDYIESLSREDATRLIAEGLTGDRIVREPTLPAPAWMASNRFAALRARLCQEAAERYKSLAATWTAALGSEPSEGVLAALWDRTARAFAGAIKHYYGEPGSAAVGPSLAVQATWPEIIEGERKQVREVGLADRTALRFALGQDGSTVQWILESTVDEKESAPERKLSLKGVQFLRDWSVVTEDGSPSVDSLLPSPDDEPLVVCVTFPWIPPEATLPPAVRDGLAIRKGRGQRVLFVSPAAYMLLISSSVRGFLPVQELVGFFTSGTDAIADGVCMVGFDQAEEFLIARGSSGSMPGALRESLLNHYELGFR